MSETTSLKLFHWKFSRTLDLRIDPFAIFAVLMVGHIPSVKTMSVSIKGTEGLTPEMIAKEVANGARFKMFDYTISILIMSFRRSSDVYFIKHDESHWKRSTPYTLLSLFLGWWGIPWGLIYTPISLYTNLSGGRDVTHDIIQFNADRQVTHEELATLERTS